MKLNWLTYSAGIVLVLASFTACNDLDLAPTNKFTELNYWTSDAKASAVLSMAYSQMMTSGKFFGDERLTDNLYEGRGNTDEKLITSGQANAALGRFASDWGDAYSGIKTCHTFLENVDRVPNMDETLKNRMKAEARFIRAYLFFRLANQYGDVPLFDYALSVEEANTIARSPKSEVIAFVRSELQAVAEILPTVEEYKESDKGRITKGAAMMLLARTYLYENDYEWKEQSSEEKSYTKITKFSYKDGRMNGVGATKIRGTINDVFAISEANGVLRVLTTDWMGEETHDQLYLLDEKLDKLGELVDFAPGEEIYAARYIGDIAYFITYHNTDPLFAVDISDPTKPTILGQIEISGFSDYLHPFGENELLGIGYETDPETTEREGVKLVMFDLTDPTDLKVKDTVVLKGTYSSATDLYKAVFVDTNKNLVGFDVNDWSMGDDPTSYHVYEWDGEKFREKMSQTLEQCCDIGKTRGLYAGDDFYLIYDKGENWQIRQFDMKKGFAPVKALDLTSK